MDGSPKEKGFITSLYSWHLARGYVEIIIKHESLRSIICREDIIDVIPREKIKEYWRYL